MAKNAKLKGDEAPALRTLWRAELRLGPRKDFFFFRSTEEFIDASTTAELLLETSPGAEMAGGVIIGIARQARLWN